ncbi:LysM peptidoglycan-binding domain-containing protein [Coraliomargarita sp. SDUM461004]|uniref:LysM peptidoglycan-binding domain-containing protein n=1 Tax=Thalassobacterium sedimentorum TaxID=3041258 RepID=A0ABU1AIH2_9BACT|nr:LysM peptidoglycan-binding domain-containing protein [Coraliomargarita sp. SDUM461004]MDQ8194612.1 LysM peptidoglycan-binding domain-containing protein [Coraliomargarita sp. SDUM461004]
MEEDIESSGTSLVPLALALLAIVLGGAGLYFGLNANQRITPLTESVDEGSSSTARIDKELAALDARIDELTTQNRQLKETIQRLGRESSQTLRVANQAGSGVESNRGELIKLAKKMSELASTGVRAPSPAPERSAPSETVATVNPNSGSASSNSVASTPATSGTSTIYKIQSGDTFGKIASLKGVSLDALLEANPDADPRRLRIGQEINIPGN